jgi:hypothetical protein
LCLGIFFLVLEGKSEIEFEIEFEKETL